MKKTLEEVSREMTEEREAEQQRQLAEGDRMQRDLEAFRDQVQAYCDKKGIVLDKLAIGRNRLELVKASFHMEIEALPGREYKVHLPNQPELTVPEEVMQRKTVEFLDRIAIDRRYLA
jgi:hypothetical protein